MEFKKIPIKTWYLNYSNRLPSVPDEIGLELWVKPGTEDYLKMYVEVGEPWGWSDRLMMNPDDLKKVLHSTNNEIWLFSLKGEVKGFFEIDFSESGKVEIVYLGLFPHEIGKGLGKLILNAAVAIAGRNGAEVWLHTCEFDHPKALSNYLKSGFEIVKVCIDEEFYPAEFLKNLKRSDEL